MAKYVDVSRLTDKINKINEREIILLDKVRKDTELGSPEWYKLWTQINEINWVKHILSDLTQEAVSSNE